MLKDKIIQNESTSQVDRRRSDVQTNQESNQTTQTIQPSWASEAYAREKQYGWSSSNWKKDGKHEERGWEDRLGNKLRLETSKTEELVQEINRRIQKSDIRLMYGTDANDREIVVYQVRNWNSKNNFETWEWPNVEFIKGEKVHVEDLRLFKHIFDEREVKNIKRIRKARKEKEE